MQGCARHRVRTCLMAGCYSLCQLYEGALCRVQGHRTLAAPPDSSNTSYTLSAAQLYKSNAKLCTTQGAYLPDGRLLPPVPAVRRCSVPRVGALDAGSEPSGTQGLHQHTAPVQAARHLPVRQVSAVSQSLILSCGLLDMTGRMGTGPGGAPGLPQRTAPSQAARYLPVRQRPEGLLLRLDE